MFRILNEKTRKKRKIAVYCMVYTKMASPQEFRFFTEKEIFMPIFIKVKHHFVISIKCNSV